jgi:hypothetical protein
VRCARAARRRRMRAGRRHARSVAAPVPACCLSAKGPHRPRLPRHRRRSMRPAATPPGAPGAPRLRGRVPWWACSAWARAREGPGGGSAAGGQHAAGGGGARGPPCRPPAARGAVQRRVCRRCGSNAPAGGPGAPVAPSPRPPARSRSPVRPAPRTAARGCALRRSWQRPARDREGARGPERARSCRGPRAATARAFPMLARAAGGDCCAQLCWVWAVRPERKL